VAEGTVSSEPVSTPNSLLNRERTGNFVESAVNRRQVTSNRWLFSIGYESNSLTIGTGNFCDKTGKQIRKTGNLQALSGEARLA
jgi:hypothetical protein